jgi:hypothetical protein
MLCASRLTPLRKPDGGLRPIAVGDMIHRLATKAIVRHSNRRDFLLPYQFGIGSQGGVEPVVRGVERALEGTLDRPYTHLTSLDFSNAFNTVDRRDIAEGLRHYAPVLYRAGRWTYGCTSSLVLGSPEAYSNRPLESSEDRRITCTSSDTSLTGAIKRVPQCQVAGCQSHDDRAGPLAVLAFA